MTQQLTQTSARPLATTASAECSPALWQRLTSNLPFEQAINELAGDDACRAELVAVGERIRRHAEPCGSKAVIALLTPLVSLYGVPDKSEAEWRAFWRFYTEALGELPLEALKAGVDDYVNKPDSEFFPKPGPLKALCNERAVPVRKAANRAQIALQKDPDAAKRWLG